MKASWKKILLCTVVLSLIGGSSILFADSIKEHVRVWMNGRELKDGGYLINNKIYMPVRDIDAAVDWDKNSGKVNIIKPNVHIFLFKGDTAFGNVNRGKLKFNVFSQVDNLQDDIHSVKVAITDPAGNVKDIQTQEVKNNKDNFWFRTYDFTYDFNTVGKYSVGFYIKAKADSNFVKVAEKVITVLN
ncbi:copper amine oxidase [Paenibacillus faecalis]|uniref:copper amine oxidase n=1 Tax=Paenibacillus faecalis TaxID=2079532 RepID=UPI000D0FABDE|nr:copper amine oxidase [Paenibacillus faecalis]